MSSQASVGLLGLGALGEIFCGHLVRAFPGLRVFDLDVDKLAAGQPRDARGRGAARRELSRRAGQRR